MAHGHPLYAGQRPAAGMAWPGCPRRSPARAGPDGQLEPGRLILASLSFPPANERESPDFPVPAPEEAPTGVPAEGPAAPGAEPDDATIETVAPSVPLPVERPVLEAPAPAIPLPAPRPVNAPSTVVPERPRMRPGRSRGTACEVAAPQPVQPVQQ